MANSTTDSETISDAMDYAQHQQTWRIFTRLVKWGIIASAITVLVLYFLINP
jgi:hypothetical protein